MTIRVNRFEISFSSSISHNHTVYSTGCYDKCSKHGEHQKLFCDNLWCTVLSEQKYIVLFSLDFKYKVDSFNLYIIDNNVKRTIGRCIQRIE